MCHFSQPYSSFCFSPVIKNTVLNEIKGLKANKAVQNTDIPVNVLEENANIFGKHITLQFSKGTHSSKYPESFKLTNISPAFKQGSTNLKDNWKPISFLRIISKIFEKLIGKQLSNHYFQNLNVVLDRDLVRNIVFF